MKKGTARAVKYIVVGSVLVLSVIMTGCGCGKKKTDPASEQVLKISITPELSPTPAPDTVDTAAVTSNGDISMVNLYVAQNPSAVAGSADTDTDSADTSGSDTSDEQNQDQSVNTGDTSDTSDEQGSDASSDNQDDGSYDEGDSSEE